MIKEEDILKYCNCEDCREKIKDLFKELGNMESDLLVWELGVSDLLKQCPTCEFRFTDKLS